MSKNTSGTPSDQEGGFQNDQINERIAQIERDLANGQLSRAQGQEVAKRQKGHVPQLVLDGTWVTVISVLTYIGMAPGGVGAKDPIVDIAEGIGVALFARWIRSRYK